MKRMRRKGEVVLTVLLTLIIVIVGIAWLVNLGQRECRSDAQCGSGQYCGSDFACHDIPVIERTTAKNNLVIPALILGIAIIIAAVIFRWGHNPFRKQPAKRAQKEEKFVEIKAP